MIMFTLGYMYPVSVAADSVPQFCRSTKVLENDLGKAALEA